MKERPILFSGSMVRAILEGRKSMTRRVAPCLLPGDKRYIHAAGDQEWREKRAAQCPHGVPGDRLWVRETLVRPDGDPWCYKADNQPVMVDKSHETEMLTWAHHKEQDHCVSIHMPRWASRLTLELTEVRVERLQEITEADAIAEGCESCEITNADIREALENPLDEGLAFMVAFGPGTITAKCEYMQLWDSINGKKHPWESNTWVWVESFKVIGLGTKSTTLGTDETEEQCVNILF